MRFGIITAASLIALTVSISGISACSFLQKASAASVPDAPTNLTLSANATSITLNWNAPKSDGGSPITGYKIDTLATAVLRTQDANTSSFQWGPILVSNTQSTETSFVDKRVVPTCYEYYRVSAINSAGTGSPSNAAMVHFVSLYGTISDATNSCGINAFDLAVDSSGNFALASNTHVLVFDKSGVLKSTLHPLANGKGNFARATGVAFDKSNNMYVADAFNANVYKIDTSGKLVQTIGSRGVGDGQFGSPIEVVLDNASNIYVLDGSPNAIGPNSKNRVQEFDSNGNFVRTIGSSGGQNANPVGIAVDKSNNLYITENIPSNSGVVKFDSNGNFVSRVVTSSGVGPDNGTSLISPAKLVVDSGGNIYVLDKGYIKEYKSDGTFVSSSATRTNYGAFITIDSSDNIYSLRGVPAIGPVLGARVGSYEDTRVSLVNPNQSTVPEFGLIALVALAASIATVVISLRLGSRGNSWFQTHS